MKNIIKKCLVCNKKFKPHLSNLRNGGGKYCSRSCFHSCSSAHKEGKESPFWKGKNAKYGSIHDWIKSKLGKATKCSNPNCLYPRKTKNGVILKPKIFDWALKKGRKYSDRKIDSFIQLCRSCHKKYDFDEKKHQRINGVFIK